MKFICHKIENIEHFIVPTTARPTTARPTTARPTTARPTTARPTTARPTTARPTTAKPTTAKPTTARPTTARPTTARPTTARPTRNVVGINTFPLILVTDNSSKQTTAILTIVNSQNDIQNFENVPQSMSSIPTGRYTIYYNDPTYFIIVNNIRYNLQYTTDGKITVVDTIGNQIIDSTKTSYSEPSTQSIVVYNSIAKTVLNNENPKILTYSVIQTIPLVTPTPTPNIFSLLSSQISGGISNQTLYIALGILMFLLLIMIIR